LQGQEPVERQGQIRWWRRPDPSMTYVVALDPSLGTGGDPAAIQVFELPSFTQVAEWQHNRTPIQKQIAIMREITRYLAETVSANNIYYSIENNTLGEAGLVTIAEMGEENIPGNFLSEPARAGSGRRYRKGFTTSNKSKLGACAKLKNLLETRRMTVHSKNLISELKTFVANGGSYAAKPGETDDLVMSLLLIIRMAQLLQTYDVSLDNAMRDGVDQIIEPMPFIML
jgi:Terminase RNaseH-like domain